VSERERAEAERAELLEREHAARVMSEEAVRRVARMQAIAAALSVALTPAQVVEVTVDHCIDAFGARRGVVALVNAEGTGLEFMDVLASAAPEEPRPQPIALDGPHPLARAARTQTLVSDRDASPAARRRYGAQVAVPLIVEERTLGVLGLAFDMPPALSADDIGLLWSLAHQSAQALFRAQLYEGERRARSEAEAAVQVRDTFLTTAAHELKTPLTVLLGNVQLLQRRLMRDGTLQEREARQLRVVGEQALRLNQLISSMLDISRLETRQLTINKAPLDLATLVQRVVDDVRPTLSIHKLQVLLPSEPVLILGDDMRLEQVLHNLLSNAVKYSPLGGQIGVTLECRNGMACVAVADQGIGIPAENLPNLFQRFYRADNVDPRQITGVGIGLFVVRAIVELHDGHVDVASTSGQGSTFTICVPLAAE
jgi:signal transduction histidine kinase